jgi:site-specific recombinase XerD
MRPPAALHLPRLPQAVHHRREARFAPSTWNQHISILSVFYQWAVAEGHASAVPFTYAQALSRYGDQVRLAQANLARRRVPKPHGPATPRSCSAM